jgi:peroxiredoxin
MKKGILFIISAVIFVQGFSQKQSSEKKFSFKIEGTIRNFSGKTIYVHHRWNENEIIDSAKTVNGKFTFNLKSVEPNLYWFTTTRENNASFLFFADESTAKVRLIGGDSIAYSTAEAGQAQTDYLEYRSFINNLIKIQQKMQADFNTAMQNNDINAQNAIKAEYQNLNGQYMNGLKSFIKSHPKSPVSAYILGNDLNNSAIPIAEVIESLTYIDKSLESNSYVKVANKRVDDVKGTTVGYTATNFSQNTPDGKKVSLTDFRGKYVLIDFWASWCRPCRAENPNVVAAYNRFKDKGFTVLGVSMDSNKDPWLAAIQQDNLTWTHVSDLKGWGNEVGKIYGVTGIPQNFLIDKEGKIVAKDLRGVALDEKLAEIIK